MKLVFQRLGEFFTIIRISNIPSEKPSEIMAVICWQSAVYYAFASMLCLQTVLILDGIDNASYNPITSSDFWVEFIGMSFFMLVAAGVIGLIVGAITGGLITVVYFNSKQVALQPTLFKMIVYLINLFPLALLIILNLPDFFSNRYSDRGTLFVLIMPFIAAALYISNRFWRWWSLNPVPPVS